MFVLYTLNPFLPEYSQIRILNAFEKDSMGTRICRYSNMRIYYLLFNSVFHKTADYFRHKQCNYTYVHCCSWKTQKRTTFNIIMTCTRRSVNEFYDIFIISIIDYILYNIRAGYVIKILRRIAYRSKGDCDDYYTPLTHYTTHLIITRPPHT